jgi:hypothetical protein
MFLAGHVAECGTSGDPREGEELASAVASSSNEELAEGISEIYGLVSATLATMFEFIAEFSARRAYEEDGCRSMGEWLTARLGVCQRTGRLYAKVATSLTELPHLAGVLARGEVSFEQVAPVVRIANKDTDEGLAHELPSLSVAQAEVLARRKEPVDPDDEASAHSRRYLTLRKSGQCTRVSGMLAGLDGETVRVALERIAESYGPDGESGTYEPYHARMADALVDMAGGRIAADSDPDRATVVIHIDKDVLTGEEDGPAETGSGGAVSAEAARRATCDCRFHTLIRDGRTSSIDLGRTTRSIPPFLTRYLRNRDQGCRFPGCGARRLIAGHHMQHWTREGPTDRSNLASLCRRHHRLVHEGGWHVEGDGETTVVFVSPVGKRISSRRPPLREEIRERFLGGRTAPPGEESAPRVADGDETGGGK